MRESPRIRRLRSDLKALEALKGDSTILSFEAYGNPPDEYLVRFRGKGFERRASESAVYVRKSHEVRIRLGASYPREVPELHWRTPIFHPNISGAGAVCLGGYGTHWVPSLNLDELCEMLWDMIRYQNYDVTSPYNRDAAEWAKYQREHTFPIDPRPIRDMLAGAQPISKPKRVVAAEVLFLDDEVTDARGDSRRNPSNPFVIE
jgi:ubiquitin-protein ligase